MSKKILILGAGGFIGSHLVEAILAKTDWQILGLDLHDHNIAEVLGHTRFEFKKGNMLEEHAWIEDAIKQCDVVLPLVAIANPALYVKDPLRVFELDFEANLAIVRLCVKHQKRVIFPSTSEVYGMCSDDKFDEETSNFTLGPIHQTRWIYSCSKQLMDRVIASYGLKGELEYTLFRPFNFMGPRLDNLHQATEGGSRAFTQFVGNVMRGMPIHLVDGGAQRRCYIYIDDAIDAIVRVIENKGGNASQRIFNIGNPNNDISIRELAQMIIQEMAKYPQFADNAKATQLIDTSSETYFGAGYADVKTRVPSVENAKKFLGWEPTTTMEQGIYKTLQFYFAK